jgi:hypothetical protein
MPEPSPEDFNLIGSALTDLYAQARPRSDLGGAWGSNQYLGTKPVATFMGRMVRPGEGLADIISRLPQENPDAEGLGGLSMLAGIAPAVRKLGSKTFTDTGAPTVAPWADILKDLVKRGEPLNRRTMRPAIKTSSGVIVGDVAGGHGSLWEAVNPAQQKGAIDGYVDAAGRFMTRDQGTIASGSINSIKAALENALFQER